MTAADPTSLPWLETALAQFYQHGLVVLPNALPAPLTQALYQEAASAPLQQAGVGRGHSQQLNQQIRRDQTLWLDGQSAAQQQYLAAMAPLRLAMNRHCLLGLTHYEAHFARYQPGDFYQKHLDAFRGRSNRVLTTVFYLNTVTAGGALQIYDDQDQPLLQVQPAAGTLVLFESERFPHEVLPAADTRYSIAGWFRKD